MNKIILILLVIIIISCIQGNESKADNKDEIIILERHRLYAYQYYGALFVIKDQKTEKEFFVIIGTKGGVIMEERK